MGFLSAVTPFLGPAADIIGGLLGSSAQKKANKANIQLQRENQAWMERMSNTEWQRGVEDMKAAGLNPMLGFSQGGASSPSSSAARVEPEDAIARGVSSAGSKALMNLQMEQMVANIRNTNAEFGIKDANRRVAEVDAQIAEASSATRIGQASSTAEQQLAKLRQEVHNLVEQGELTARQADQLQQLLPELLREARSRATLSEYQQPSAKAEAEVWEKLGAAARGANVGANALQQILSIINSIRR